MDPTGHSFTSWMASWGSSVGNFLNGVNDQYVGGQLNEVNETYIAPALETACVEPINQAYNSAANFVETEAKSINEFTDVASNASDIIGGVSSGASSAGASQFGTIASRAETVNPAIVAANVVSDINLQAHANQSFEQGAAKVMSHAMLDIGTGAALKGVGSFYGSLFVTSLGTGPAAPIAAGGVTISGGGTLYTICKASNEAKGAIDHYIDSKVK